MFGQLNKKSLKLKNHVLTIVIVALLLITGGFLWKNHSVYAFPSNGTPLDNFNRANENPLDVASGGRTWTQNPIFSGDEKLEVLSNAAGKSSAAFGSQYFGSNSDGPDSEVYATLSVKADATNTIENFALYSRIQNPNTSSTTFPNGTRAYSLRYAAGAANNFVVERWDDHLTSVDLSAGGFSQTFNQGDSVGYTVTGTGATITITVYYKASGGSWSQIQTFTDTSANRITAAGYLGLETVSATNNERLDDFGGGTIVTNVAPAAPTLITPASSATGVPVLPQFQLRTTDADNDYLRYEIQVCSTSNCSSVVRTICQDANLPNSCSASQTGWSGQDQQSTTAYTGSSVISGSTIATHTYQTAALTANTQYWWRAYAIDPGGTNTASTVSGINSFTTSQVPAAPTLVTPAASTTVAPSLPIFQLRTTDAESDYLKYFIQIYTATACGGSQVGSDIDQTSSQTNWQGQDASSATAYNSSSSIGGSTIARYQFSGTALTPGHLYSWRAKAIDPGGSQTFGSLSSCQDFTVGSSEVKLNGGTNINGGSNIQ